MRLNLAPNRKLSILVVVVQRHGGGYTNNGVVLCIRSRTDICQPALFGTSHRTLNWHKLITQMYKYCGRRTDQLDGIRAVNNNDKSSFSRIIEQQAVQM